MAKDRYSHMRRALGAELFDVVQKSKILVVGAGGIGCELLKNLVFSGFLNVEIIDLDTIDVSNLNRQFLFRNRHVGMSKSKVAKEAALNFNPHVNITSHHGNIKAEEFGVNYFKGFDVVLNALDNVNARQHVNRLCLAANIPLIDSGTTGYLGQVNVIFKGETKCYDCEPKSENKKTFPICTIRNTPDKPVHCIVWAKELFKLMFGNMAESMLSGNDDDASAGGAQEDAQDGEDQKELQEKEKEIRSVIMSAVERPQGADQDDAEKLRAYAKRVFNAVFDNEIALKLKLRNGYKGAKKKPEPLSFEKAIALDESSGPASGLRDQRVLSIKECTEMFVSTVEKMWSKDRREQIGDAVFDKDDDLTLDFVMAASNLRSQVFDIERKSKFDVKGIAGNIIHAIATTNAIVAGIQVVESIKLLSQLKKHPIKNKVFAQGTQEKKDSEQITKFSNSCWVVREPIGRGYVLQASTLGEPNSNCYSCGNAVVNLYVDVEKTTLGTVVDKVLRKKVGVNTPSVMLNSSELYCEGEGLEEDELEFFKANLPKTLVGCPAGGIKNGSILDIEDFSQNMAFKLVIQHKSNEEFDKEENPDQFTLTGDQPMVSTDKPSEESSSPAVDDSDIVLVANDSSAVVERSKRTRTKDSDAVSENEEDPKRSRSSEDEAVVLVD
uniref:SUMO-activating enzyme subunit n=1 Tax=Mucochytrium quahogii TaxID=96639 RepID=A0A7S2RPC2_9STRA|mmetsp:Transcript_12591/g.22857  ORF Transcript_12591/g.22857 Transcript_12591/m.22857 type:complete len:666 (-) Transcript_12591:78-2075(-)